MKQKKNKKNDGSRKISLLKLLIAIPILWILAMMIGLNDNESSKTAPTEQINRGMLVKREDHDHRKEEKIKTEEQQLQQEGPSQVNAPRNQDPNAPGELGKPVVIDKEKLSPEERKKYDDGWKNNAFNQYVSDMVSIHRSLADIRDPA
jgi:polypeptide N-acetylgalactosaminyltransferase